MDTEIFKQISIRGRFAFGLTCLEKIIDSYELRNGILDSIIDGFWRFTSSKKLGQYEDYFITIDPWCVLSDFPALESQPEKMHEFGYDNISYMELKSIYELYEILPESVIKILTHLATIANADISAGCGEYSNLTYEPTVGIIEIIMEYKTINFYKPEDFLFSSFKQNHGWGDGFTKDRIGRKE